MERDSGHLAFKAHLEELQQLQKLIASVNRGIILLSREAEYREAVKQLKTVPGVSTLTAMILLTELCDIARFSNLDRLASYVGLIPDTEASGETEPIGGLTFRRNAQ